MVRKVGGGSEMITKVFSGLGFAWAPLVGGETIKYRVEHQLAYQPTSLPTKCRDHRYVNIVQYIIQYVIQ